MGLPVLDDAALSRLVTYYKELKHWSRRINLIAKKATDKEILEKHFLDSLTLLPLLQGDASHLLDVGTGAGFPGLVCKAAEPRLRLTLVEPRQKRVAFLSHIKRTLGLEELVILDCRVEDESLVATEGDYTHITSRAVTEVKPFLEMCARFMRPGVQVICMKGPKWREELSVYTEACAPGSFSLIRQEQYVLPESGGERHLLVFEGNNHTRDFKINS